jgi:hypothetical protein
MSILSRSLLATAAVVVITWNIPAHALSMHECSVKYRAAQTAKTLNGMSWKDFRKAECGPGAAAAPTSTSTKAADTAPAAASTMNTAEPSKSPRIYNTAPTGGSTNSDVPDCDIAEICRQVRRQGADAYLSRSVRGQQGRQYERRSQMDPERRWLLQHVQQAAEGRGLERKVRRRSWQAV